MDFARFGKKALLLLGLPIVLVSAWWFGTANSTSFFWPPLSSILGTFNETWFEGRLVADVMPSLARLAIGYSVAVVAGVGLGIIIGSFQAARALLEPVLEFFRAIPPPVLIPPITLVAGIGDEMKVIVIAISCMWPVLLNTVEGVRGIDEVLGDTASSYRLRRGSRLIHLTLRGASPQIFTGARQALSIGIIIMVVSEMFAASNGLGYAIIQFQRTFAIPEMWTGIILLGIVGLVLALIFRTIESHFLAWYEGLHRSQREG